MSSRTSKVGKLHQQFVDVTQSSLIIADSYLKNNNNNIDQAIAQYYANSRKHQDHDDAKYDKKLVKLYETYQDPDNKQIISIDGTMEYLQGLNIEPEDLESLTLAYLMHSTKIGEFDRHSFLKFWSHYKVFDLNKMSTFIKETHNKLISEESVEIYSVASGEFKKSSFKDVYDYTFKGLLEQENQNKIDYALSIEYWRLLIPVLVNKQLKQVGQDTTIDERESLIYTRLNQWYEFLTDEYHQNISHDKWSMFYLFVKDVIIPDPSTLKDYDEMAAWPSVMDEYVYYLREHDLLH